MPRPFENLSATRWTEFHLNRKDPIWEIQRFPNLGTEDWGSKNDSMK